MRPLPRSSAPQTSRRVRSILTATLLVLSLACMLAVWGATRSAPVPVGRIAVEQFMPNDTADGAGWASVQWNFAGAFGVDAPAAWANLIAVGSPGGQGVTVAVVDTGVSANDGRPAPGSPELGAGQLVPGWDFVDDDSDPSDENGHGTQVASTIAEDTNNAFGLTGLAYGARIMPVRVFDRDGVGEVETIARGVRFAVEHGAKVINLSFAFGLTTTEADIGILLSALEYAAQRGVLSVGASGNEGIDSVDLPARSRHVLAVGATTEFGCVAAFSNHGRGLDLVAPGGGTDATIQDLHCKAGRRGRAIHQLDMHGNATGAIGTSMAVPHVAATAALVIASRVVGANPSPAAIAQRLQTTAQDLGTLGYDERYGWGLVSAGAATAPARRAASASQRNPGRPTHE
jgi:serine protease